MPQRRTRSTNSTLSLALQAAALSVLAVLPHRRKKPRLAPRRLAASLAFATLFFAGAALSAGAGNSVTQLLESDGDTAALQTDSSETLLEEAAAPAEAESAPEAAAPAEAPEASAPEEAPAPAAPEEAAPAADESAAAPAEEAAATEQGDMPSKAAQRPGSADSPLQRSAPGSAQKRLSPWQIRQNAFRRSAPPVLAPRPLASGELADTDPEVDEPGVEATIWLHRTLPDPTPPARRLKPSFARQLTLASARAHVDWALVLGVLRARGQRGASPATPTQLRTLTRRLAKLNANRSPWSAALALDGHTTFADRAVALQRYNRAVGLRALVKGLESAKQAISNRILRDRRISMYSGGRGDIAAGRVNIRVLVLVAYLAESHGQVSVSSLISGHRLYARPGVISAHIYGLAADISVLGGLSILGHSQPGGITEQAVRNVLLLPAELQPRQVISLLGMGGPSFPMGNHDDHIHVGY